MDLCHSPSLPTSSLHIALVLLLSPRSPHVQVVLLKVPLLTQSQGEHTCLAGAFSHRRPHPLNRVAVVMLHKHLSHSTPPSPPLPSQALTCCTVEVKTLDDRLLNIPINDIVQ